MEGADASFDRIGWHLPPDSHEKMKCGRYFAVAFGCMTPKQHFRSWYAEGKGMDCSAERSNLYSCAKYKLSRRERRAQILQENHAIVLEKTRSPFFEPRKGPPPSWPIGEYDPVAFADSHA